MSSKFPWLAHLGPHEPCELVEVHAAGVVLRPAGATPPLAQRAEADREWVAPLGTAPPGGAAQSLRRCQRRDSVALLKTRRTLSMIWKTWRTEPFQDCRITRPASAVMKRSRLILRRECVGWGSLLRDIIMIALLLRGISRPAGSSARAASPSPRPCAAASSAPGRSLKFGRIVNSYHRVSTSHQMR
jgi:hypothetical protein